MHISEGVLSPAVLAGGIVLTAAGTYIGVRKADYSRLTSTAVLSSTFFVASLVHVPLGPGNVHLILNGLMGIFLGWAAFPAVLISLLLQAVLFRFGGLAVLGVNVFDMAFPAVVSYYLFRPMLRRTGKLQTIGAFCCGALSVAGAAVLTALALGLSAEGFWTSAKILLVAHIPIMLLEGCIVALIVAFITKARPELLQKDSLA